MLKEKAEIEIWLYKVGISRYLINEDLSVDVNDDVDLYAKSLTEIPIQFGKIMGTFYGSKNRLKSLKGCPKYVSGSFFCNDNKINSLEYLPNFIGGFLNCMNNPIKTINLTDIDNKVINGKCLFKYHDFKIEGFENFYKDKDELQLYLADIKRVILQQRLEKKYFLQQ